MHEKELNRLVIQAKNGDSGAAYELWTTHIEKRWATPCIARYFPNDAMERNDILSGARDILVQTIARLNDPLRFEPWAKTVIRNYCISKIREKIREEKHYQKPHGYKQDYEEYTFDKENPLFHEPAAPDQSLIQNEGNESKGRLLQALDRILEEDLKPEQREVIEIIFFQGKTKAETARQLNVDPGTVTYRLNTALKQLDKSLRELIPTYGEDKRALRSLWEIGDENA